MNTLIEPDDPDVPLGPDEESKSRPSRETHKTSRVPNPEDAAVDGCEEPSKNSRSSSRSDLSEEVETNIDV